MSGPVLIRGVRRYGEGEQVDVLVVDLAGGNAVHVRLHHDREQCLIDPAASFQQ